MGDLAEISQEVDETKVSLGLFCLKYVYEGSKNTVINRNQARNEFLVWTWMNYMLKCILGLNYNV